MTFAVQFIVDAQMDLDELYAYLLTNDSPDAADALLEKIAAACASLARLPERGHFVPELKLMGVQGYRELRVGVHRVVYEISGQVVSVHAVLDARRDLRDLLLGRLIR